MDFAASVVGRHSHSKRPSARSPKPLEGYAGRSRDSAATTLKSEGGSVRVSVYSGVLSLQRQCRRRGDKVILTLIWSSGPSNLAVIKELSGGRVTATHIISSRMTGRANEFADGRPGRTMEF